MTPKPGEAVAGVPNPGPAKRLGSPGSAGPVQPDPGGEVSQGTGVIVWVIASQIERRDTLRDPRDYAVGIRYNQSLQSALDRDCSENSAIMNRDRVFDVSAEPACPFRIKMIRGETFEIRHPEMVQVGRTTATIFTWMNEGREDPREREQEISIILIETIERLKPTVPQEQSQN